jgi:hypothetical protein
MEPDDTDLLPDDLLPAKHKAVPLVRTPSQKKAIAKKQAADEAAALEKANAARLAQIVNLHIAGFSLAEIGAQIGASAAEIDRMLTADAARYVRNQPALRTYIRNWVSKKYTTMIEADWEAASDPTHRDKLENQDRVVRILDRMAKLHGAEMPVQSEVKVDAAPEAVEALVSALAAGRGLAYDTSIFDTVPGTVIHDADSQMSTALEVSRNAVEEGDPSEGF